MSDTITVKTENAENNDSNDGLDSLPDLTEFLEEVKKEEQAFHSDAETQPENNETEALPESFFDDLYREALEADSTGPTTDADIRKLQELLEKKKKLLREETQGDGASRKRKHHNETNNDDENQETCSQAKRSRNVLDANEEVPPNRNESPPRETESGSNIQEPASTADGCVTTSTQANDAELELENLLKTEDYNSDEEPSHSNQGMALRANIQQPTYPFQNAMPMFDPTTNQMMNNIALGGYPMMFNMGMGFPPGFYPPNMMNMQMMGCGVPQMGVPSNQDEVQCLPVISNHGLPKMPSFKPIKLENKSKAKDEEMEKEAASAEERKKKIFDACTHLLDKMEFAEPTGKFVFTSTVTKLNPSTASNSILQNITNVSYNFQAIGPKLNLQDWGLKEISGKNAEIAKKICMSADKYFDKIEENANTLARKLIKVENAKADRSQNEDVEMEVEEPTMSSFFKNSMTQTEALVCRECVIRKRKVGHNIAVQASVFTGSVGSQTTPELNFGDQLTEGLSENQLKAMYEFSKLIREPPKNTSSELLNLRENLINIYNLSQRQYKGPVPIIVDNSTGHYGLAQNTIRDPRRVETNTNSSDPRRFTNTAMQAQTMPRQNYSPHGMHNPNQQNHSAQFPGSPRTYQEFKQNRQQELAMPMQIPNQQRHHGYQGRPTQFSDQPMPEIQNPAFPAAGGPQQASVKRYGRGAQRR